MVLSKSGPAQKLKTFYASAIYFALYQCTRYYYNANKEYYYY